LTRLPYGFAMVVNDLGRRGYLETLRGRRDGIRLIANRATSAIGWLQSPAANRSRRHFPHRDNQPRWRIGIENARQPPRRSTR
jgi:hypothetical protein